MRIITDLKEIYNKVEVGDTIEYKGNRFESDNTPTKKSIVINIEKCLVDCGDGICNIMIEVDDYEQNDDCEGCYMFSDNESHIKALYKKEDFLKEEEFKV